MDRHPLHGPTADRIEEFLIDLEERFIARGMGPEAAKVKIDAIEIEVMERIDADPALRTSMVRLEEYLTTWSEQPAAAGVVPFPEGPKIPPAPRQPRTVTFAAAWAVCPLLMLVLVWAPDGWFNTEDPGFLQKVLVNVVVTLGLTAPVGATAVALVGLRQIHFGKGGFTGRTLATLVTLLYPTLLAAALAGWAVDFLLAGSISSGLKDAARLMAALAAGYGAVRGQLALIRGWFDRMEASGRYWTPVGEIPPSKRCPRHGVE